MLSAYDNWLLNQADKYFSDCVPEVVKIDYEVDYDDDGNYINVPYYIYSCEDCEEKDCEHWREYNDVD